MVLSRSETGWRSAETPPAEARFSGVSRRIEAEKDYFADI